MFNFQIYGILFKVSLLLISHFDIIFSFKSFLFCNHPLCLYQSNVLRLSMAQSNISLGKCHIENKWVILKYLLIFKSLRYDSDVIRLCHSLPPLLLIFMDSSYSSLYVNDFSFWVLVTLSNTKSANVNADFPSKSFFFFSILSSFLEFFSSNNVTMLSSNLHQQMTSMILVQILSLGNLHNLNLSISIH